MFDAKAISIGQLRGASPCERVVGHSLGTIYLCQEQQTAQMPPVIQTKAL